MKLDLPSVLFIGGLAASEACAPQPKVQDFWAQFEDQYYFQGSEDVDTNIRVIAAKLDNLGMKATDCSAFVERHPKTAGRIHPEQIGPRSVCLEISKGNAWGFVSLNPIDSDRKIHAWLHEEVNYGSNPGPFNNYENVYCRNTDPSLPLSDVENMNLDMNAWDHLHAYGADELPNHEPKDIVDRVAEGYAQRRVWTEMLAQKGISDQTRIQAYIKTREQCPDGSLVR